MMASMMRMMTKMRLEHELAETNILFRTCIFVLPISSSQFLYFYCSTLLQQLVSCKM